MGLEIGEKRVLGEGRLSGGKGRKKKNARAAGVFRLVINV